MEGPYSHVDLSQTPPLVTVPRAYNAAVDLVDRHVRQGRGERVAFVDDTASLTYAALADRVARVAALVRASGVLPEQRALMCLQDTCDFPAIFFGVLRAGAVAVPVNTLLRTADYAYFLEDTRAGLVFVSEALYPTLAPAIAACARAPKVVIVASPNASPVDASLPRLDRALDLEPMKDAFATTSDDAAFWLYSSGSTGAPKGAVHLHSHMVHTAALYARGVLRMSEDDVVFSAAKLFFAYGLGNAMSFPLYVGARAVLSAERPTPASVLRVLRERAPTIFNGVPTLFAAILADESLAQERGSAKLRVSTSAGEALPKHVGERWRARFGTDILDGIGSTEMLHIFLSNRPGDVRYGTTGKPVPGYRVKLVGDDGEPVADGEEGALWVSGPSSCTAYWNQRERSLATFHGPWTRTGDHYVRDADGYYTYSGRSDDMLKVGGIWVSPFEVESALSSHPAVLEAAVVGHTDADGLVKPRAFVVLKDHGAASDALASELKEFVKQKIAHYKYPRWIEFSRELPKTATGKVQRYKLRA